MYSALVSPQRRDVNICQNRLENPLNDFKIVDADCAKIL